MSDGKEALDSLIYGCRRSSRGSLCPARHSTNTVRFDGASYSSRAQRQGHDVANDTAHQQRAPAPDAMRSIDGD